jgi:hypothetical protein
MLDYTILFLTLSFLFFRIQRQRLTFHPTWFNIPLPP